MSSLRSIAMAATLSIGVAACSTLSETDPRVALVGACDGWEDTLSTLADLREAGELSEGQVARVDNWVGVMDTICLDNPENFDNPAQALAVAEQVLLKALELKDETNGS